MKQLGLEGKRRSGVSFEASPKSRATKRFERTPTIRQLQVCTRFFSEDAAVSFWPVLMR